MINDDNTPLIPIVISSMNTLCEHTIRYIIGRDYNIVSIV